MNHTIKYLSLQQVLSTSPIVSLSSRCQINFIRIASSKFNKISNNILYSSPALKAEIKDSSFSKILTTALKINSEARNSHINFGKTVGTVDIDRNIFKECSDDNGGAMFILQCRIFVTNTEFVQNTGKIGGAIRALIAKSAKLKNNVFIMNYADYNGAVYIDLNDVEDSYIGNCNFTQNTAKMWNGALRLDRCGGQLVDCYFDRNQAKVSAAFFDYSCHPFERNVKNCLFLKNECVSRGTYTAFHILQKSHIGDCIFAYNKCNISANSISLESVRINIELTGCYFTGSYSNEIEIKYDFSFVNLDNTTRFNQTSIALPSLIKIHKDNKEF